MFVGAGVSRNYGYPDWNELTTVILTEMNKTLENMIEIKEKYTSDEYLLYPEYFYNQCKQNGNENKYYDVIKKCLNPEEIKKDYKLFDLIFDLSPAHIITTNYDEELEKVNNKRPNYDRYEIIRTNKDLPDAELNKFIIKMHGDFINNNLVLKESDYLNYEKDFTLIDVYIKSLFATNTILFVGFSTTDPNFKKIVSWVQHFRKGQTSSYYLDIDDKKMDEHKSCYFKSKGIEILHFTEFINADFSKIDMDSKLRFGDRLQTILQLLNGHNLDYVDNICSDCCVFEKYKSIYVQDIIEILEKYRNDIGYFSNDIEMLNLNEGNKLSQIIKEYFNGTNIEIKIKTFIQSISKAGIKFISFGNQPKLQIDNYNIDSKHFLNKIFTFNFNSLKTDIEEQKDNDKFLKAFILYQLGDFENTIIVFEDISKTAFEDNDHFTYFKSEYFRQIISRIVDWKKSPKTKDELLDKYNSLPKNVKNEVKQFMEFFDKLNADIADLNNIIVKMKNARNSIRQGGYSQNNHYKNTLFRMLNIINFVYANHVTIGFNSSVQNFVTKYFEAMLISYTSVCNDGKLLSNFGSSPRIDKFDYEMLFPVIEFLEPDELYNLIEDNKIEHLDCEEAFSKLLDSFFNLISYKYTLTRKDYYSTEYLRKISNFIILFTYCRLDSDKFNEVIKTVTILINDQSKNELIPSQFFKYTYLLLKRNREKITENNSLNFESFFKSYLSNFYTKIFNITKQNEISLFLLLVTIIDKAKLQLNFNETILKILNEFKRDLLFIENNKQDVVESAGNTFYTRAIYEILPKIYLIANPQLKLFIKDLCIDLIRRCNFDNNFYLLKSYVQLTFDIILYDIVDYNTAKYRILDFIRILPYLLTEESQKKSRNPFPKFKLFILNYILKLKRIKKIDLSRNVGFLKGENEIFDSLIFSKDKIDVNKIDFKMLFNAKFDLEEIDLLVNRLNDIELLKEKLSIIILSDDTEKDFKVFCLKILSSLKERVWIG